MKKVLKNMYFKKNNAAPALACAILIALAFTVVKLNKSTDAQEYPTDTVYNEYYEPQMEYPDDMPPPEWEYDKPPMDKQQYPPNDGEVCTQDYKPVCGENLVTYPNSCWAKMDNVKIKYYGECQEAKCEIGLDGIEHCYNTDEKPDYNIPPDDFYPMEEDFDPRPSSDDQPYPMHHDDFQGEFKMDPLQMERMKREITRVERELQRYEAQVERMEARDFDMTEIRQFMEKVKSHIQKAGTHLQNEEWEQMQWALEDARDVMNFDIQDKMRNLEERSNVERWLKDTGRMIRDMEREATRIKDNDIELPHIYDKIISIYNRAKQQFENEEYESVQWALEDLHDIAWQFWDKIEKIHREMHGDDFMEKGKNIIGEVEKGLQDAKHTILKLEEEGKNTAVLHELMEKAWRLLDELKKAVEKNDEKRIPEILEKLEFGLKEAFEDEIQKLIGNGYQGAWEDMYKAEDLTANFELDDDQMEMMMEKIANKMSQKIMHKLLQKGLPSESVQNMLGSGFEDEVRTTLEQVSFMEKGAAEILDNKGNILNQIKDIDAKIADLEKQKKIAMSKLNELKSIKEKIANYNFANEAGEEIKTKIEEFIATAEESGASRSEIEKGIADLIKEAEQTIVKAKKEKFEKGMIPFADTDDNEWYTQFAAEAKEYGYVKGTGESGGKELNPAGLTNLAEAIVMFGRIVGERPDISPASAVGSKLPDWAKPSAAGLESANVDLDNIFGAKNAGDIVTRAEVARLLKVIFDLKTGETSGFADIGDASGAEADAIGAVNRAGIMTGEGGTDKFNVKGPLNRAALVKILIKAKDLLVE